VNKGNSRLQIAVLISGTGTNLNALIKAVGAGKLELDIVQVISNRADAPGLEHARKAGIHCRVINAASAGNGDQQDQEIAHCLLACRADLVLLAGFMRIVGKKLTGPFAGRMINLHPSLLPSYPGLNTYDQVLAAGDAEHGASIHFVTAELDAGPIISQVRIPVESGDTAASLAQRLAPNEHRLLLATVELFVHKQVRMHSDSVLLAKKPMLQPLLLNAEGKFD